MIHRAGQSGPFFCASAVQVLSKPAKSNTDVRGTVHKCSISKRLQTRPAGFGPATYGLEIRCGTPCQAQNPAPHPAKCGFLPFSSVIFRRVVCTKCLPNANQIFCVIMGDIADSPIRLCPEYQTCRIRAVNRPRIAERALGGSWQGQR